MLKSKKQKQKLVDTYIENHYPELLYGGVKNDYNKLFYCNWLPERTKRERQYKSKIQKQYPHCCFNHAVGEPTVKFDDEDQESDPVPLMGYNRRILQGYLDHKKCSENKCRGSGTTEIVTVRYMIFKYAILNTITNHKCVIIPGTSSNLSNEISARIKAVCDKIPDIYAVVPTSDTPNKFVFKSGGIIMITKASPNAIRGFENIGDVILEEVAHWDLIDDTPVYQATQFVHQKTKCHVFHSTTPRGRTGFYYKKIWDPEAETTFFKHTINWREVAGLPVMFVEELWPQDVAQRKGDEHISTFGDIYSNFGIKKIESMGDILKIRSVCNDKYENNTKYKEWFDEFFGGLTTKEILDVPKLILDINEVIAESIESRNDYDQELDNKHVEGENAIYGRVDKSNMRNYSTWDDDDFVENDDGDDGIKWG